MTSELFILLITAASIGFFHTLFGPDHYLPFIVMAKARQWSLAKTIWITVLCGIGHVGSSIVLGAIGIAVGIAVTSLEGVESVRGELAAWALIAFGLVYMIWGIKKAFKNTAHSHGLLHAKHEHETYAKSRLTPWVLFIIFVLGPCEPLIPLLMYPAVTSSALGVFMVSVVFVAITIATMTGIVLIASYGISFVPLKRVEKYSHALAGLTIVLSGLAIQLLGL